MKTFKRGRTEGLSGLLFTIAMLSALFGNSPQANAQNWPSPIYEDVYKQTPVTLQCSNGSFESAFTDWTGFRGKRQAGLAYEAHVLFPTAPLLSTSCVPPGPGIGNSGSANTCHFIQSSGTDPNLPSVSHPMTTAGGSSLRIGGNDFGMSKSNGYSIEGVSKRFIVQAANSIYRFRYSSVMDKAHDSTTAFTGDEPYFQAIAIDPATGAVIARIDQPASGFNPLMVLSPDNGAMVYSIWSCAQLDLSNYVGKEVIVYFVNSDCSQGAHTAYTYIDDVCTECDKDVTIEPAVDTELKLCEPGKTAEIKGTFTIPPALNTSNVVLTIEVKQAGTTINTLTGGTISGNTYSFTLTQADLKGLGCYDFVAVLEYDVTTPSGNVVHVKKESDTEGFKAGVDNDVCLVDCPPPPEDTCLGSKADVTCGDKPGTYVVTLTPQGVGGVIPDTVEITSLTPGVTVVPAKPSYPVIGGEVKITLAGANPGDVVELQVNGTAIGEGSVKGNDLCCNGKIEVTIPKDLDCWKEEPPKLWVEKTCDPAVEIISAINSYEAKCRITVHSSGGPISGPLSIADVLSASGSSGAITAISSAEPWVCTPATPLPAGTPVGCTMNGSDLNAAGGTSVIDVMVGFTSAADVKGAKQCVKLDNGDRPAGEACADITLSTLTVDKVCGPATAIAGSKGFEADCKITVTATGSPLPQTIKIVDQLMGPSNVPGFHNEIVSMTSTENWACPAMPVNVGINIPCLLPGVDLAAAGGQSVIDVKVHFPDAGNARESQECVEAAGLDAAGTAVLTAPRVCVKFTVKTTVVAPKCDPATTKPVGDKCRCTIQGMVPISKTECGCRQGTKLINGACRKPPPKCDGVTAVEKGGQCVCRYSQMNKVSATACSCRSGYEFKAGKGCVRRAPKCDGVTAVAKGGQCVCRYSQMNKVSATACSCRSGYEFKAGKGCVRRAPKCDGVTAVEKGGQCMCRYPRMKPVSATACACGEGFEFKRGKGCVKPAPNCPDETRYSSRRERCEPICSKREQYDVKRNACIAIKEDQSP